MNTPIPTLWRRILAAYYGATLLFLLLDIGFQINVRIAFLEPYPAWRGAYYGLCFACFALMLWRPAWTSLIGAVESLATLIALIISIALRSMLVSGRMLETGSGFVTLPEIINFLIAGGIAYLAWNKHMTELFGPRS